MVKPHTQTIIDEPRYCDFCKENGVTRLATVDGRSVILATAWSNMCDGHFKLYGRGLGLGVGQKLVLREKS